MIWALLAMIGVPLWLCALGIVTLVLRNRGLRRRSGNVPVRLRKNGSGRWHPGHAVWVHDVFAFRGSPAAWMEALSQVDAITASRASSEARKGIRRLGDDIVIATFALVPQGTLEVAARTKQRDLLLGPFSERAAVQSPRPQRPQLTPTS